MTMNENVIKKFLIMFSNIPASLALMSMVNIVSGISV